MKRKIDNCRVRRSDREIKSNGERAKNRETGTEKVTKGGERENTTVKGEKGCERGVVVQRWMVVAVAVGEVISSATFREDEL